ncbi:hypothetical protein JTE90_002488 [Oedothorax gibbosus]|uniref:Uncharacterized protein n=1 Tax=Oedothorax gibbosus TaxID=931172 RepID=A0AAV6TTQ5_9ARAC|nr:hypothetical protein JTE90_002488 [Oedothorax gibbosus]
MCFNRRNGMRLLRKCRLLTDGKQALYFNKNTYHLDERDAVKEVYTVDGTYTHVSPLFKRQQDLNPHQFSCDSLQVDRFKFEIVNPDPSKNI